MKPRHRNFFAKCYALIPGRLRRTLHGITAGIVFSSFVETVAMGIIALFISALSDPEILTSSSKLQYALRFLPQSLVASPRDLVYLLGLAACVLMFLKNGIATLVAYWYSRFSTLLNAHFSGMLLSNYLNREYEWHVSKHSSDLVTEGTWRQYIVVICYMGMLVLNDAILICMLTATLLYISPILTVLSGVVLGGLAFCIYRFLRPRIDKLATRSSRLEMALNKDTLNLTQGIKELIISANQQYFYDQYQRLVSESAHAQAGVLVLARVPSWIFETAGFFMLCGAALGSMYFLSVSSMGVISGQIALLAIVAWRVIPAFNRMVSSLSTLRDHLPRAEQVIDSIMDAPDATLPLGRLEPLPFTRELRTRALCFRYRQAERDALLDVDFHIRSGETVGLVGRSGSGKSTLADLLIGLLEPTSGSIAVDDVPLTPAVRGRWMAGVGYVGQNPFFIDGSIGENVAFGVPPERIDADRIARCCHMAALDSLIAQLPEGLNQPLGERAEKLSGGQRQRVAIARALYDAPRLLVLDEATSALDQQSENTIKKTIQDISGSLTILIIAHRLATVEQCDRVVWLEDGRVVMEGSPEVVLPRYRESLQDNT